MWNSDKFRQLFIVFSIGFFSIASQTLLFREYLCAFESNDIAVGLFFTSWFLWISVSAWTVAKFAGINSFLAQRTDWVMLSYIPAFIIQLSATLAMRQLAGIESYALLSAGKMSLLALMVNAPVSIVTGAAFPLACKWLKNTSIPVSKVFIFESAGSFLGGLIVTLLLSGHFNSISIFLLSSLFLALSFSLVSSRNKWRFAIPIFFLILILAGIGSGISSWTGKYKWTRLLAEGNYQGSIQTGQAEYLFGSCNGQWTVMREGAVCEVLPDSESAARAAALHLCQNPSAKKILIVGAGIGVCREFLRLPQIELVSWVSFDNEFAEKINGVIPEELKIKDSRFRIESACDIRKFLSEGNGKYDIAIINMPELSSLVMNRYFTQEFYRLLKRSIAEEGIAGVRFQGGENSIGPELANIGSSFRHTLEKVFTRTVLVPGQNSWFIASDSAELSADPAVLADRFSRINGASSLFPPEAMDTLYLPERASFASEKYDLAELPEDRLYNTDSKPLAFLFGVLLLFRQSDFPISSLVNGIADGGLVLFLIPLILFLILRVVYVFKGRGEKTFGYFDCALLVLAGGFASIAAMLTLMFQFQSANGSLYLYIGLVSSLFMLGLGAGGWIAASMLSNGRNTPDKILYPVLLSNSLLYIIIPFIPAAVLGFHGFMILFALSGFLSGFYIPIAAELLGRRAYLPLESGSILETYDHLGACAGAAVTGLLLMPVFGAKLTWFFLAAVILINIPIAWLRNIIPGARNQSSFHFNLRKMSYVLFFIASTCVLSSIWLEYSRHKTGEHLNHFKELESLATGFRHEVRFINRKGFEDFSYLKLYDKSGKTSGYVFCSEKFAPEAQGYSGRIVLAMRVDLNGKLQDFKIIQSKEMNEFLEQIHDWSDSLRGSNVFDRKSMDKIATVSGATFTSTGILNALKQAGENFALEVISGKNMKNEREDFPPGFNYGCLYLPLFFMLGFAVCLRGGYKSRMSVLILSLVIGGVLLDMQYSVLNVLSLSTLELPSAGFNGLFFLVVILPVIVAVFGNFYCGYICPFGALQEIISFVVPSRFMLQVGDKEGYIAKFAKYLLLFAMVVLYCFCRENKIVTWEPLVNIFSGRYGSTALFVISVSLLLSLFVFRFWCRFLCPAGAFLSLLNGISPLKKFWPVKIYSKCTIGVSSMKQLDCINCDCCRDGYSKNKHTAGITGKLVSILVVIAVASCFVVFSCLIVSRFVESVSAGEKNITPAKKLVMTPPSETKAVETSGAKVVNEEDVQPPPAGIVRNIDEAKVRKMIESRRLSDREAGFYRTIDEK